MPCLILKKLFNFSKKWEWNTTFKNVKKNCGRSPGYTYSCVPKIFHSREYHGATIIAAASQIQERKSSAKSNTESYHPALRSFALTLHLYSAQAYRLVKHSLSSLERCGGGAHKTWFSSIFFNIKDLSATNFWIKSANFFVCLFNVYKEKMCVIKGVYRGGKGAVPLPRT